MTSAESQQECRSAGGTKLKAGLGARIGAIVLLLLGSLLTYAFVIKIFARIWDPQAYLQREYVFVAAFFFLWGGMQQWSRWRMPLGIIWLALCGLAFLNSTVYETADGWPQVPGFRTGPEVMRAMSHASIVMGCLALGLGSGLILWQRHCDRRGRNCNKSESSSQSRPSID